jgi:hypothetical protein
LEEESEKGENMNAESDAQDLADFIIYLRKTTTVTDPETGLGLESDINISDTSLAYAISDYLGTNFEVANKAVNKALGIK